MSDPARLRYVVLPNRFLPLVVQRGLFWFAVTALFAPPLWILAQAVTDAEDAGSRIVDSLVLFGVAGAHAWLAWHTASHTASEVTVDGDEVRWRGFIGRGRAALGRLRRVRESRIGRNKIEFDFGRLRRFTISPAEGLPEFVERLMVRAPYLQVQLPPSVWRSAHRHPGLFEESG